MRFIPITLLALASAGCDTIKEKLADVSSSSGESAAVGGPPAVPRDLSEADFDRFVAKKDQVVVVDFHATWCGPCKVLAPQLEAVVGEFGNKAVLGKVDVDQAGALPGRLGVSSIPDVRIYRDGKEVDRFIGAIPESEIREKINAQALKVSGVDGEIPDLPSASGDPEAGPPIQKMSKDWIPPGIEKK